MRDTPTNSPIRCSQLAAACCLDYLGEPLKLGISLPQPIKVAHPCCLPLISAFSTQVSDAVLDACLEQDPYAKVGFPGIQEGLSLEPLCGAQHAGRMGNAIATLGCAGLLMSHW